MKREGRNFQARDEIVRIPQGSDLRELEFDVTQLPVTVEFPPDIHLDCHCGAEMTAPGSNLSRHSLNVTEALCSDIYNYSMCSYYLHLTHLQHRCHFSKNTMVIHLLIYKAKQFGLFEVAKVYLKPLL